MLTADAFGVLPPIARLSPDQAIYHFLSGFTAKIAGTEKGVKDPEPTFSACFGAPFMPRHPVEYGNLLRRFIAEHDVICWLVNTGWTGGPFGVGSRMPLEWTRTLLGQGGHQRCARTRTFRTDGRYGFSKFSSLVPGIPSSSLNPRETWAEKDAFDRQAARLVEMFVANFAKFETKVAPEVVRGGPKGTAAAA